MKGSRIFILLFVLVLMAGLTGCGQKTLINTEMGEVEYAKSIKADEFDTAAPAAGNTFLLVYLNSPANEQAFEAGLYEYFVGGGESKLPATLDLNGTPYLCSFVGLQFAPSGDNKSYVLVFETPNYDAEASTLTLWLPDDTALTIKPE